MTSRYFSLMAGIALLACVGLATAANITFQVNMAVQERLGNFDSATDTVLVRGSFNGWAGYTEILTTTPPDSVYRITVAIDSGNIEYKFVLANRDAGDDRWEGVANRTYTVTDDATLDVVYYNDQSSSAVFDLEVLFQVDMRVRIAMGRFDPTTDVVMVRGGTPPLEWGGDANQLPEVTGSPGLYADWVRFDDLPYPGEIQYKFVALIGGDPNNPDWEQVPGGGNRLCAFTGTEPDNLPPPSGNGYQEIVLDTVFFSGITFDDITQNPVDVIFTCDVRPAYYKIDDVGYITDIQTGGDTVRSVDGVGVNGLFDQWVWGSIPAAQQLHDDGVAPDEVAGDSIWTASVNVPAGSQRIHPYKYGVNDYDNEAGYEKNHSLTVDDTQPTQVLPLDCWGILDSLYDDYNWTCASAAEPAANIAIPQEITLYQNYPNPFNPSTRISFSLPATEKVTLRILNILGQEAAVMDLGRLSAGVHEVTFTADNLVSGIYFYRVEAGSMTAVRKMLLLK
jgi:hypothetical protein